MDDAASTLNARNPWSWYAIAASRDLGRGQIMPIVLNGESLVLWRSREGRASAWSDRCPHRGMRLSYGAIQDEALICPYHGWTFGIDGYCVKIPAHPQTTPSRAAKARIYPCVEADGYLWACIGEPATDGPAPVPGLSSDAIVHVRTMHVPLDADLAVAALLLHPLDPRAAIPAPPAFEAMRFSPGDAGGVSVALDPSSGFAFEAVIAPAGSMTCALRREPADASASALAADRAEGTASARYRLLFQPTTKGACAIHLGAEPGLATGLNRALVRFRRALDGLAQGRDLPRVRKALARLVPAQVQG